MLDNRAFLVLVVGIAALVVIGSDWISAGLQNDRNNELHDRVFNDIHYVKVAIETILNSTGGIDENVVRENTHFNASLINSGKLDRILELLNVSSSTATSGVCPPTLNVSSNTKCLLVD